MTLIVGYREFDGEGLYHPFEDRLKNLEPSFIKDRFYYCGNARKDYPGVIKTAKDKTSLIVRLVTGRDATEKELEMIGGKWSIVVEANEHFRKKSGMDKLFIFLKLETDSWY